MEVGHWGVPRVPGVNGLHLPRVGHIVEQDPGGMRREGIAAVRV